MKEAIMKKAIKNIAYASILGAASMLGATQTNADLISITNTSSNQDIGGQGAVINFIDDPAVTNGYDEGIDVIYDPREPAHPLDS